MVQPARADLVDPEHLVPDRVAVDVDGRALRVGELHAVDLVLGAVGGGAYGDVPGGKSKGMAYVHTSQFEIGISILQIYVYKAVSVGATALLFPKCHT